MMYNFYVKNVLLFALQSTPNFLKMHDIENVIKFK